MKLNPAIFLLLLFLAVPGRGQIPPALPGGTISRSGQFIVYGVDPTAHRSPALTTNSPLVHLEPTLLTVSCERIKQTLLNTLNIPDQWRGKIRIGLHPYQSAEEDIVVASERFSDGWNYRISLPDAIEPARLVRVLTQVLLLEMANRNARDQSATLPLWLAEGMPPLLLANSDMELVLQSAPPAIGNQLTSRATVRDSRPVNLLKQTRERLGRHAPLGLEELGEPPAESLEGEAGEIYRSSAIVFIHELLQLKNGGVCLAAMLPELPWDPDWRVSFLKAFRGHFQREVDLAKWWALQSTFIAGRTPAKTWSRAESLSKLDETLRCPLQIQTSANSEPFHTDVPLQSIIRSSELPQQIQLLREKINLLEALKLRTATELAGLIEQYRSVIADYLHKIGTSNSESSTKKLLPTDRHTAARSFAPAARTSAPETLLQETLLQLDILDQRREAWKALSPESTSGN